MLSGMAVVVGLPARLLARRRAERLLQEGRRHVVALDPEGAEGPLRQALATARESGSDLVLAGAGEELYQVLLRRRRLDEAVPVLAELASCHARRVGPEGERAASWRNELIRLLGQLGRYAEAEPPCRERLLVARRWPGPDARGVGLALVTLAWCLRGQGRRDEAEGLCREAEAVLDAGPAPRGAVGWALLGLAAVLLRRMALEEAEAALHRALGEWASVGRSDLTAAVNEQLMDLYVVGERHGEALALSEVALNRVRRGAAAADRERQLRDLDRHAFLLRACGRDADAVRYERRAGYLRQAMAAEPLAGDGSTADCTGPVFEGEPLPDWGLPGVAVAARAC
jgi:tetratricopeptide (TPR) repeat protein